jgi:Family of unknown function (DUF5871)
MKILEIDCRGKKIGDVFSEKAYQIEMSSANSVVVASAFSTSDVSFSQIKVLESGGKQVYVNYGGRNSFVVQTPQSTLPYGMSVFDKAGPVKYSAELSLRGYDEAGKMQEFYEMMHTLDEFMIDQGVKNSRAWFKCDPNREVIKAFYTPTVRFSVDKEGNRKPYPPTVKLQLRQRDGVFETKMYDDKRNLYSGIPMEELLVKGAQITALIQCTGVWFAGSKFGLSWKAIQIRVDNLPQSARGFTFVDDGESAPAPSKAAPARVQEEEEEEEEPPAPPPKAAKASVVAAVVDDEAEDQEPIVVPKKPAVVIKKKVVAK